MTGTATATDRATLISCGVQLRLEQRLLWILALFAQEGIQALALKGAALTHLDHADPTDRFYGDVDLLLHAEDLASACAALAAAGYTRKEAPPTTLADRLLRKGATMVAPDGIEIDLHHRLLYGTWGLVVDTEELWDTAVTFELAGRQVRTIDREHRLLHACMHAALTRFPPAKTTRDVAVLLAHPDVDHDLVAERVRRWQLEPVVARAIGMVEQQVGEVPDVPTVAAFRGHAPGVAASRALVAYTGEGGTQLEVVTATARFVTSRPRRWLLLAAMLVPGPAAIRHHGIRFFTAKALRNLRWLRARRG